MAILSGPPGPKKPIALKGVAYVTTYRGRVILRAWPKKRKRPLHPKTVEQADWLGQAAILAKYLDANQQIQAREATKGTPLYYRDLLEMAMRGTDLAFIQPDGRILYSVATRQGVSESLDVLSQNPRSILVRAGDLWVPVETDQSGLVPISQSDSPFVAWGAIPGPANSGSTVLATQSAPVSGVLDINGITVPTTGILQVRLNNIEIAVATDQIILQLYVAGALKTTNYDYMQRVLGSIADNQTNQGFGDTKFPLTGAGANSGLQFNPAGNCGGVINIPTLSSSTVQYVKWDIPYRFGSANDGYCSGGGGCLHVGAITGVKVSGLTQSLAKGQMTLVHLQ